MDDNKRSLIPLSNAALTDAGAGAKRIMSSMIGGTLAVISREPMFKIGEYEWHEPDYRQILLWADTLKIPPEEVIRRLLNTTSLSWDWHDDHAEWQPTTFCDGRISKLNWDLGILPCSTFQWVEGLKIEYIRFAQQIVESGDIIWIESLNLRMPELVCLHLECLNLDECSFAGSPMLETLVCAGNGIGSLRVDETPNLKKLNCRSCELSDLDLTAAPDLEELNCAENNLGSIDVSSIPELRNLDCEKNELTKLDLFAVPWLSILKCGKNRLIEIDLSLIPRLWLLDCRNNQISELDLTRARRLTRLYCGDNPLSKLDLSHVPRLSNLGCWKCRLAEIDLSLVPQLSSLSCSSNRLTDLCLFNVPELRHLYCDNNLIAELDLSSASKLEVLHCRGNPIDVLDVRALYNIKEVNYLPSRTRLLQRSDQHFDR